jgi:serine/threonine protein kinase
VADATFSMAIGHSVARSVLAINVALCGLASIFALNSAGYAHGDIKPGNMMLDSSGLVTLIDLGTAQRLGDYFTESSNFALGELSQSSVDYDLVCLGSTLAFIEHALHPNDLRTRDAMLAKLSDCTSSAVTRLAQQCLGMRSGFRSGHCKVITEHIAQRVGDHGIVIDDQQFRFSGFCHV